MNPILVSLIGCVIVLPCVAQDAPSMQSEAANKEQPLNSVKSNEGAQRLLRIKGMKAAISDIENNRLWILNGRRSQDGDSGQPLFLQSKLEEELGIPTDDGTTFDSNRPHPSVLDEAGYAKTMPLAVIKGYNDIMWAEIEHRYGSGTRTRIEKLAMLRPTKELLPFQIEARRRDRQILLAPDVSRPNR
jgi:hypothetical protein